MTNKIKPIQLDFKPSITLTLIICTMGLCAGAILILPALVWQIKLMLGTGILGAVIYAVCQYGLLLLPWSCVALSIGSNNQLQLLCRNGNRWHANVRGDSVVTPYLTVMNYDVPNVPLLARLFTTHLVILPDMLDEESFRKLRVWLRWGRAAEDS